MWNNVREQIRTTLLITCLCPMLASSAIGYGSEEWPLEVKAKRSDVVVVGEVIGLHTHDSEVGFETKTADVQVRAVLKGAPQRIISVFYHGLLSEENPDCCAVGKSYVFFLKRAHDGIFESVNSGYGIYPVSDAAKGKP